MTPALWTLILLTIAIGAGLCWAGRLVERMEGHE
jgi:hypothetical protein